MRGRGIAYTLTEQIRSLTLQRGKYAVYGQKLTSRGFKELLNLLNAKEVFLINAEIFFCRKKRFKAFEKNPKTGA